MPRSVLLISMLSLGCASAPSAFSARSAANTQAAAGPRPTIGRALVEEPPAPGASTEGWIGFAGSAAPSATHAHHMMTMPDGTVMEMDAMPSAPSTEPSDAH